MTFEYRIDTIDWNGTRSTHVVRRPEPLEERETVSLDNVEWVIEELWATEEAGVKAEGFARPATREPGRFRFEVLLITVDGHKLLGTLSTGEGAWRPGDTIIFANRLVRIEKRTLFDDARAPRVSGRLLVSEIDSWAS